jgi:signal transduction histidine kinase
VHEAAFETMSEAVLAVAGQSALEPVPAGLVRSARRLVDARYAALGVPDEEGTGFDRFLTDGMSDELIAEIGPLPRTHGLLGAMLSDPAPYRTDDIRGDPRFQWWPTAHPDMRSFLGVPIVSAGRVVGAFYLTDKEGAPAFDAADQRVIELLAAHAAVAIDNARLHERSRELGVVEERNRLARELHDAMTQTLFSLVLTADAAATLMDDDPQRARAELSEVRVLARRTMAELRSLIFELRPAELEQDGLVATIRKRAEVLGRAHDLLVEVEVDAEPDLHPDAELEVQRVVQEALHNAVRHASGTAVRVVLAADHIAVTDDGVGFDPTDAHLRSRHLGLVSMEERAAAVGGVLRIDSAPGAGSTVTLELPGA